MTMAAFMDLALYHPEHGYYTRSPYPSAPSAPVAHDDVGMTRMLGGLLAHQLATFARALGPPGSPFTVIDAGAGDGRLSHAVLRALHTIDADLCAHTHLHLVERSGSARHAQRTTMTAWTDSAIGGESLPDEFEGVVIARELLSAMPAHLLSLQGGRLVETHVELAGDSLVTADRPPSSATLADHVRDSGLEVPPHRSVTVSPDALGWVANAAGRLRRGFIVVIDRGDRSIEPLSWLDAPGEQPLAANVDFAAVRRTAEHEGCVTARFISQASYLAELAHHLTSGFTDEERRAFAALTGPAGCGQTTRVLMLVKNMDLHRGELS